MADRRELEQLFITLLLEDKQLETQYKAIVARSKEVARDIQAAIAGSLSAGLIDDAALKRSFESITEQTKAMSTAAREASQAVKEVGGAQRDEVEATRKASEQANKVLEDMIRQAQRAFDAVRKAGTDTTEEFDAYRKTALDTATALETVAKAAGYSGDGFEKLKRHVREATYAQDEAKVKAEATKRAQEELDDTIASLSARVATQRNLWASRVTDDEQFKQSTQALKDELLKLVDVGDLTDQQMRKITQSAAYAQRGLDSANKVASRGGLAWTTQIALANQFEQSLRKLGPAGEAAASALGFVSKEMRALMQVDPTRIVQSIVGGMGRLAVAAGAAAAALVAGITVALFRLGTTAANAAEALTTAATRASLTVETFQEYAFVAEQSGVKVELLTTTLQRLQRRAVDAQRGNAGLRESFERLGVTLTDAQGKLLGTEELFAQVADGLNGIENDAERVALAFKVFDTEGARLLPMLQRGSAGIQELRDRARELGLVVSGDAVLSLTEFKNAMNEAQKQLETSKIEIVAGFMPAFTNLLIPLLQNTVVPALQRVAASVSDFTTNLRDAGPAGAEFRNALAGTLAPIVSFSGYLQAAGASLDVLNYKLQLNGAEMNAFWRKLGQDITNLPDAVKRFLGLSSAPQSGGRDSSGFNEENIARWQAELAAAQSRLDEAIYRIENPGAITLEWLNGIVAEVNAGSSAFTALGDAAEDAVDKIMNPAAPAGSLAFAEAAARAAAEAFSVAVDDEARAAAKALQEYWESVADGIRKAFEQKDPLEAAKQWTGRLTAEMREGVKSSTEVFDLLVAGIDRMRQEASTIFTEFGWDSGEYRDAIQKLNFLEAYLQQLEKGVTIPIAADTSRAEAAMASSLSTLQTRYAGDAGLVYTLQAVERTQGRFQTLQEAFRGLADAGVVITAPMLALLQKRFEGTTTAVENTTSAVQRLWDAERARQARLVEGRFAGDNSILFTLQAVEQTEGRFESLRDAFRKLQAAGVVMNDVMLRVLTERFQEAQEAAEDLGHAISQDVTRAMDALTARFSGASAVTFTMQAVEQVAGAFTSVGDAIRKLNASGVVVTGPMLDVLTKRFESTAEAAETAAEAIARFRADDLPRQLTVATATAAAFGDQAAVTAAQLAVFENAIKKILELDPAADVSDFINTWTALNVVLDEQRASAEEATAAQAGLEATMKRLNELTGTAPSQWDDMRDALKRAAAAGKITDDQLKELLETISKLEQVDQITLALDNLASNIDIGTGIAAGLTKGLEGIRDGNLDSVLSGLTDVGTAIGTAIGGPAVGAIINAIGKAIQAIPALFQAISDIFTGDNPARRKLRDSLAQTVAGAFRTGILEGLSGAADWQENLRQNVQEAVLGAVVDAFVQAAVMQAIFAPFIDEFTKILNRSGVQAAFEFFDSEFAGFWNRALDVVEGFVLRGQRYFRQIERVTEELEETPLRPSLFELPNASVSVLAAPQWALELTTAAGRMSEAGDQMITAAQMMQATFNQGIPVTQVSTRGVDAVRSL